MCLLAMPWCEASAGASANAPPSVQFLSRFLSFSWGPMPECTAVQPPVWPAPACGCQQSTCASAFPLCCCMHRSDGLRSLLHSICMQLIVVKCVSALCVSCRGDGDWPQTNAVPGRDQHRSVILMAICSTHARLLVPMQILQAVLGEHDSQALWQKPSSKDTCNWHCSGPLAQPLLLQAKPCQHGPLHMHC